MSEFMKKSVLMVLFLSFLTLCPVITSLCQEEGKKKNDKDIDYYEFEELTVKVKIQEPEVLFILDEPDVDVKPFYGNMDFLSKIEDPLVKDNVF